MRLIKNPYKLLVVDIDGTLVNKRGAISPEDKMALTKAKNAGMGISLSTGRVTQSALSIINQLALDSYHIFFDGALVSNPRSGQEVYIEPISQELVRKIIEFAHRNEIDLELYSSTHYFIKRETWGSEIRRQFFGLQPTIGDFYHLWQQERIIKGTLLTRSTEEKTKAESFYRHFQNSLNFSWTKTPTYPEVEVINIVAPNVTKGKALEILTSHLGIVLSKVIAIGDGANDISLLSKAGLAVAMGDAPDELKAVAHHVTFDVDHNGVAAAISKFLL